MGKLRNTLAAISILLLASCGGNKDYYMSVSYTHLTLPTICSV